MKTQTIEVEGLPEGWKAVAYRRPMVGEYYLHNGQAKYCESLHSSEWLIIQKIQPRRIVLEETEEENQRYASGLRETQFLANGDVRLHNLKYKWREVKETDIPLNSDDPKLSLSVDECKNIIVESNNLGKKIDEFIKENS